MTQKNIVYDYCTFVLFSKGQSIRSRSTCLVDIQLKPGSEVLPLWVGGVLVHLQIVCINGGIVFYKVYIKMSC